MALIRRSAASLAALADRASIAEVMFEQILLTSFGTALAWRDQLVGAKHPCPGSGPDPGGPGQRRGAGRVPAAADQQAGRRGAGRLHPGTGERLVRVVELKQWSQAERYEDEPTSWSTSRATAAGPRCIRLFRSATTANTSPSSSSAARRAGCCPGAAYLHNAVDRDVATSSTLPQDDHGRLFTGSAAATSSTSCASRLAPEPGAPVRRPAAATPRSRRPATAGVAADEIRGREQFVLLDEQRLAYEFVLHAVESAQGRPTPRRSWSSSGGPGSGKSVIALSLLGELPGRDGRSLHATGSGPSRRRCARSPASGSPRIKKMFNYFNSFMDADRTASTC